MAANTKSFALDVPGFRISLCTWEPAPGRARVGSVTISQRASKAMGHHCEPGYDGGETARSLRKQLDQEIHAVAREHGIARIEVYASKRGCQPWQCDVVYNLSEAA